MYKATGYKKMNMVNINGHFNIRVLRYTIILNKEFLP